MYGLKAQKEQYRDYTLGSLKPSIAVCTPNAGAKKAEAGESLVRGQRELHSNTASRNKHKRFTKKEPEPFPRTPDCHRAYPTQSPELLKPTPIKPTTQAARRP